MPADPGGRPRRLDLRGVGMLSATVVLALLPLILGHTQGWPSWVWFCLAASLIPLVGFVMLERRLEAHDAYPLINLHVLTRRTIAWGLTAYAAASLTYFSLLFTLALFLQQGLGRSPLYSGLALVSWVAAFGIGGPVVPHLPSRAMPLVAPFGYLVLALSYLVISAVTFTNQSGTMMLFLLLGSGGLGSGIGFTANIRRLTAAASPRYAPDMSGVITTVQQTAGLIGIATFGTLYFSLVPAPDPSTALHGFAVVSAGFSLMALLATAAAYLSTHLQGAE
jgi:hypothetical protein